MNSFLSFKIAFSIFLFFPLVSPCQAPAVITITANNNTTASFTVKDEYFDTIFGSISIKNPQWSISTRKPVFLTGNSAGRPFNYLIYPGEQLVILNDSLVLKNTPFDADVRNNELSFFKALRRKEGTFKLAYLSSNLKPGSIETQTREVMDDTKLCLSFLQEYAATRKLSPVFVQYVRDYFLGRQYAFRISNLVNNPWSAETGKTFAEIKEFYRDDLDPTNSQIDRFLSYYVLALTREYRAGNPKVPVAQAEKVVIDKNFSQPVRDYFYFIRLKDLYLDNKSSLTFKEEDIQDPLYRQYLDEIRSSLKSAGAATLLGPGSARQAFSAFITSLGKKLVFIDFWASWCVPCIDAIPNTLALAKELQNSDIGIVFISVDKNKSAWINAERSVGLNRSVSWLLQGNFDSSLAKQLRLSSIPRYVMVNAQGKIVTFEAPHPGDPKLKQLFEKELAQLK